MRWWRSMTAVCALTAGCGGENAGPAHPGEQTYNRYCFSCHAAGVAGAPRVGDPQGWQPRIDKGDAALLESTIAGMPPGMPPRGLCSGCTEEELSAAIDYMIEQTMAESP